MKRTATIAGLVLCVGLGMPCGAQAETIAFVGARVLPIEGAEIEPGVVLVENGRVRAVGEMAEISIPVDATRVDLTGKVLMPGLVDTHSHLGRGSGGDRSAALHPDVRILDSLDPRAENFWKARAGGITTVNVMPGSGYLMSGQTAYLKLRLAGAAIEDYLLCIPDDPTVCGGLKMANGTNPQHAPSPPFPGTRGRAAASVRELWVAALEYRSKVERAKGDPEKLPARDLGMEALLEVLDGRRIVHHHTHRADDILTVLRIAEEFGYHPVLHHVSEGWKVAGEIAAAKAPCSIIVIDSPGGKHEAVGLLPDNGAQLEAAGVQVAFHTDDSITDSRYFLRSAAMAVRSGMSRQKALEGMTIEGARMLRLDDRVGSLAVGKDADLIVLSGDPLSVYTKVEQTWVEGEKVYDLATDSRFLLGGEGVYPEGADAGDHEDGGER